MKLAVIGLGIGSVHAQVISRLPELELVGVCDLREEVAAQVAEQTGSAAFTDWVELVERSGPEAICLCTNPKTHLPLGLQLAQRGLHVLCEKPMAPTVQQCLALTEACERAGVVLMVAQKKRFAPAFRFLKDHIAEDFGRPLSLNYRFHPGQVPKDWFWAEDDGGGPLVENAVHVFDSLRYLIGEIETVRGLGGNILNPTRRPQLDLALGLLEFQNGAVGAVELGTASEWCLADEEFYLSCEHAVARSRGGFDRPCEVLYAYRKDQQPRTHLVDYTGDNSARDFVAEIMHFVTCIRTGDQPLITGRDAARSIACCLAMKRAVREQRTVRVSEEWVE